MHEYSLAVGLMECVLNAAHENNAAVVNHIYIKIGKMTHVNPMQLEFCLKSLSDETIAQNAAFTFEIVNPDMKCECGYFGKAKAEAEAENEEKDMPDYLIRPICPKCGKNAEIIGGTDLSVESIDID
jgi:hydrogenase nickel incorporation protein HypA/HybF